MQTEITTAETMVRREEDRLLERMEEAEAFAAELKAAEAALKSGQAQLKGNLQQMETDRVDTEQELEKTSAERARVVAAVSPGVLALFERVSKHRKGLAMSEARDGLCTQCHVRLRPQVYNELRRNESVMQCESCSSASSYFLATPVGSAPSPTPDAQSAPAEPGT